MTDFHYEIETINHYSFENFTVDGQSMQDGTPTPSAPVPIEVIEGANVWHESVRQVDVPFVNVGITWVKNADGTYTANGTATANAWAYAGTTQTIIDMAISLKPGTYTATTNAQRCALRKVSGGEVFALSNVFESYTFTVADGETIFICPQVPNGVTVSNATYYVQIVPGATTIPYVPYGSIGIVVGDTATSIPLQGNVLASLPNGTRDVLIVDSAGHVTLDKRTNKKILDGTESWSNSTAFAFTAKPSDIASGEGLATANILMTDRFKPALSSAGGNCCISGTNILFYKDSYFNPSSSAEAKTWAVANNITLLYKLATPQTIDLGYIDVSNLKDISEEIPISIISTLDPETTYSYINHPSYDVLNPYEDYNAPEYAYPPNHFGQEWEIFDANNWNKTDMLDYTGQLESHAVYTVELCELMQSGTFDWKRPELDWSEAAYDEEQYERFCKYFESRFMFREISMLPPLQWFTAFRRMMIYELMPKYRPLYVQVENGISPLGENEYYKERHVSSAYPETLLSGNSDYISSGEDREFERIKIDNAAEALEAYRNGFRSVDAALGDELEILFISMYTSYVNGL